MILLLWCPVCLKVPLAGSMLLVSRPSYESAAPRIQMYVNLVYVGHVEGANANLYLGRMYVGELDVVKSFEQDRGQKPLRPRANPSLPSATRRSNPTPTKSTPSVV